MCVWGSVCVRCGCVCGVCVVCVVKVGWVCLCVCGFYGCVLCGCACVWFACVCSVFVCVCVHTERERRKQAIGKGINFVSFVCWFMLHMFYSHFSEHIRNCCLRYA